jgi:defect-in-organelle-trafficking protein DotD
MDGTIGTIKCMKYLKRSALIAVFLSLSACASEPPAVTLVNPSEAALADASYSVSRSISSLSEVAQASRPIPQLDPPADPHTYGMGGLTSVDWSGPAEQLVQQLAKTSGYQFRSLGAAPAIPLLVSVYAKNMVLADILRDVGYQCGRRASVIVYPDSRVIELRYAPN